MYKTIYIFVILKGIQEGYVGLKETRKYNVFCFCFFFFFFFFLGGGGGLIYKAILVSFGFIIIYLVQIFCQGIGH